MGNAEDRAGTTSTDTDRGAVQSVDRALTILGVLARRGDAGVTEIGAELGVHKSTAFRLLSTLEAHGFVEQTVDRGTYRLGMSLVRLAGVATSRLDLSREGRPVADRLAAELGETVNIAIRDGDRAVNVVQARGASAVATQNWIGQRTPLHATSSGKVLLAAVPADVRDVLLAGELTRFTPATTTDPVALEKDLARVAEQGWAATTEEYEVGLNAVAAPVRGVDGEVVAALSVSGPAYRLTPDSLEATAARVTEAALEIGRRLGHYG